MASEEVAAGGYQRLPGWVVGFHGCDKKVGMEVLTDPSKHLAKSRNAYDWLGSGIYFWENDCDRAMQFAIQGMGGKVTKGKITEPFVIGAIIDLGLCFNLFDQVALKEMRQAYEVMAASMVKFKLPLPENGKGQLVRPLDRTVLEHVHVLRALEDIPQYDTVRAGFGEGESLYPGTSITERNHIQIAVRDTSCIRGYFLPRGVAG